MQNTAKSLVVSDLGTITIAGTLLYVQVQEPAKAFQKAGTPEKPPEYKASVVLTDEDFIDELESFAKRVDAKLSLKKVRSSEFEGMYKVAPPEDAGKNVWILTVRKPSMTKAGVPVPKEFLPRVYEQVGKARMEVTNTKLPTNGSVGALSIAVFTMNNGGTLLTLKNVLVTEMIEYVKPEGNYAEGGSEFDTLDEPMDDFSKVVREETKPVTKAVVKPKAKANIATEEDMDCPF